ncbi:exonuclease mut-7 homolog isoform X2 [Varroa jacobsoni]|nr:exonuclease mut-7 homolog isoform X2 [Varroa jacobsoni]
MPTSKMFDLLALAKLLSDPNITKVGFGMSAKQQLIKVALGGYFLQGVVDMQEAFRAIEITNSHLTAPSGAACEGLRTLEKICYNLLDKQIPAELCDNPEGAYLSEMGRIGVVTEAFIVFHAYVELERRVRPSHLQSLIAELLTEPAYDDYLKLCIPWNSVYLVETVDGYLDAVEYLKTCSVIGFDSEWKPTRCPGAPGRMALLQVASDDKVFLFDVLELHRVLTYGDWALLKSIFTDSDIVKLGFDTRDDAKLLKDFMGPVEMESVKDMALIMRALEKLRPEHMTPKGRVFPVVRGLSRLCNVLLGRPLNKSKKLSMTNWEKRPLAKVFLEYAALDAHCLVLCWRELLRRLGKKAVELIDISVIAYSVETEALRQAM